MKRSNIITLLIPFIFCSGVIRDDVNENEHLKLANQPLFNCVGQVFKDNISIGSCVLVKNKFALSAAHVFIENNNTNKKNIQTNASSKKVEVSTDKKIESATNYFFSFNGKSYQGKMITVHPMYLKNLSEGICDICIIELNEEVKKVTPAIINTSLTELNSIAIGVGYGFFQKASEEKFSLINPKSIKNAGENSIDLIDGYQLNKKSTLLESDFDSPKNIKLNKMGDSKPLHLEYIPDGGDSGGGLFRKTKNTFELIGICQSVSLAVETNANKKFSHYGSTASWTRVSVFNEWIKPIIDKKSPKK